MVIITLCLLILVVFSDIKGTLGHFRDSLPDKRDGRHQSRYNQVSAECFQLYLRMDHYPEPDSVPLHEPLDSTACSSSCL